MTPQRGCQKVIQTLAIPFSSIKRDGTSKGQAVDGIVCLLATHISQVGVSWGVVPRPPVSQYLWISVLLKGCFLAVLLARDQRSRGRSGKSRILWSHVPQNSSTGFPSPLPTLSAKVVGIPRRSEPDDIGMIY